MLRHGQPRVREGHDRSRRETAEVVCYDLAKVSLAALVISFTIFQGLHCILTNLQERDCVCFCYPRYADIHSRSPLLPLVPSVSVNLNILYYSLQQ